jgi:hypothetical protein
MIAEQTAIHNLTNALPACSFDEVDVYGVADINSTRSEERRKWQRVFADRAKAVTIALIGALATCGSPSFCELERRSPTVLRLGPGLSRESDSFWPLSEW